jgi:hypothetical protein
MMAMLLTMMMIHEAVTDVRYLVHKLIQTYVYTLSTSSACWNRDELAIARLRNCGRISSAMSYACYDEKSGQPSLLANLMYADGRLHVRR